MTIEECNKIISEYMDPTWTSEYIKLVGYGIDWTALVSMEALLPVWDKLEFLEFKCEWHGNDRYEFTLSVDNDHVSRGSSILEAATRATIKAIEYVGGY